jgi:hypothetical protein
VVLKPQTSNLSNLKALKGGRHEPWAFKSAAPL